MKRLIQFLIGGILTLSTLGACVPTDIMGQKPDKTPVKLLFYPGGVRLDDLVVFEGKSYFGTVETIENEPLDDLKFTTKSGKIFIAECTAISATKAGQQQCAEYEIYRSDDETVIPERTVLYRPRWLK